MKTIKTLTTALLITISGAAFAAGKPGNETAQPVIGITVESPELEFGNPADMPSIEEPQAVFFFAAPDMEWGSPAEMISSFKVAAPAMEWGAPAEMFASFRIAAPEMEWGSADEGRVVFSFPAMNFGEPADSIL